MLAEQTEDLKPTQFFRSAARFFQGQQPEEVQESDRRSTTFVVATGESGIHDYGVGMLLCVVSCAPAFGALRVSLSFQTIDDGSYVWHRFFPTAEAEKANAIRDEVAAWAWNSFQRSIRMSAAVISDVLLRRYQLIENHG